MVKLDDTIKTQQKKIGSYLLFFYLYQYVAIFTLVWVIFFRVKFIFIYILFQ